MLDYIFLNSKIYYMIKNVYELVIKIKKGVLHTFLRKLKSSNSNECLITSPVNVLKIF